MKWCPLLARILWGLRCLSGSSGSCSVPKEVKQILISNSSRTPIRKGMEGVRNQMLWEWGSKDTSDVWMCMCRKNSLLWDRNVCLLAAFLRLAELCACTMCASVSQHSLPRLHLLIRAKLPRRHLVPGAAMQPVPYLLSAYEQTERAGRARWQIRPPIWLKAWAGPERPNPTGASKPARDLQSNQPLIHPLIGSIHIEMCDQRKEGEPGLAGEQASTAAGIKLHHESGTLLDG